MHELQKISVQNDKKIQKTFHFRKKQKNVSKEKRSK